MKDSKLCRRRFTGRVREMLWISLQMACMYRPCNTIVSIAHVLAGIRVMGSLENVDELSDNLWLENNAKQFGNIRIPRKYQRLSGATFSPLLRQCLISAGRISVFTNCRWVGVEHVLAALCENPAKCEKELLEIGVDAFRLAMEIREYIYCNKSRYSILCNYLNMCQPVVVK